MPHSQVYKGTWKGIVVAIKTITFQDKVFGGDKAQSKALMEAAISGSILHPNLVATYSHDLKPLQSPGMASTNMVSDWKLYIIQVRGKGAEVWGAVCRCREGRRAWLNGRLGGMG